MYTVPDQPGIPDEQKIIIKTEVIVREKHLTIEDLLYSHAEICTTIQELKDNADSIVDELIGINEILPVGDIPVKFNEEKE